MWVCVCVFGCRVCDCVCLCVTTCVCEAVWKGEGVLGLACAVAVLCDRVCVCVTARACV